MQSTTSWYDLFVLTNTINKMALTSCAMYTNSPARVYKCTTPEKTPPLLLTLLKYEDNMVSSTNANMKFSR